MWLLVSEQGGQVSHGFTEWDSLITWIFRGSLGVFYVFLIVALVRLNLKLKKMQIPFFPERATVSFVGIAPAVLAVLFLIHLAVTGTGIVNGWFRVVLNVPWASSILCFHYVAVRLRRVLLVVNRSRSVGETLYDLCSNRLMCNRCPVSNVCSGAPDEENADG